MMKKLLEKWPLMWKSRHEREMQELTDEYKTIMHNKMTIDIQHEKVFNKMRELSGVELELITLSNGFRAWAIKGENDEQV